MSQTQRIRIGDLLVKHRLISEAQLQLALEQQKKTGRKLGWVLIENGYVTEDELLQLLATQLQIPFVPLASYELNADTCRLLPETLARRHRALPLAEDDQGLLVAMADPTNIFAYDELQRILKRPFRLAVVKEGELLQAIDHIYQSSAAVQSLAIELGEELSDKAFDLDALHAGGGQSDAPVVRLLETLLKDALAAGASDIHIEPGEDVLRIRKRIDGVLHEQVVDQKHIATALVSRVKLMGGLDISEKRLPQDGRFNLRVSDRNIDVRLSTMPTRGGEAVVLRLLDKMSGVTRLDRLGMAAELSAALRSVINRPHGLVLVTGPTGSGKTTTLYAMLNELNQPQRKIITVEDPVEYTMPRLNQVQVSGKIGLDFARVLRAALRQDPDVILVGEIRDRETAEIALRASMTGHLVLSSLHTNDAISTATRLLDMGAEPYLLASALQAILAQRLLRRVCDRCGVIESFGARQRAWLETILPGYEPPEKMRRGAGCPACQQTGYRGREAVHEFAAVNQELANALRQGDMQAFADQLRSQADYRTLLVNAMDKVAQGITTLDEVVRVCGGSE